MSLKTHVAAWENTALHNEALHAAFTENVDATLWLKAHRDYIEANQHGFGDRAFHHLYKLLVDEMPPVFSFLEIGVFKGQVTSLVSLCAKQCGKEALVFGVTTLTNTEDVRCKYPEGDYAAWIKQVHDQFGVEQPELIVGKSSYPSVVKAVTVHDYDLVLIDGGHDLADVVFDIETYAPCVKVGGYLLMDDASITRLNVGSLWPGLEDVAQAVKDTLDKDERFKFQLCVGHLNLFRRVK